MPGGEGALDLERVLGVHERLAGQHPADRVDRLRREMREVRERFLLDLPVLAVGRRSSVAVYSRPQTAA